MAGEKLLVVEDDASLSDMLVEFLREEGYQVASAPDTATARELLGRDAYEVLVLDLNLPDGSGLDVFRHARASSPFTKTVVVTGYATTDTAIAAVREGAYSYLTKPLEMKDLRLDVERAIRQLQTDRKNEALTSLLRVVHEINALDEPQKLLDRIVEIVVQATRSSGGSILVYDEKEDVLRIGANSGLSSELVRSVAIRPGERISGWVLEKNEPIRIVGPANHHPLFGHLSSRREVQSSIIVPLVSRDRRVGVLTLFREEGAPGHGPAAYTDVDLEVFRVFADSVAAAITNGRILTELRRARADLEHQKNALARKNDILTQSNRLLSEDNIRREQELRMAAEIQRAFLPSDGLDVPGIDLAASLVPMHGVAGDFYSYRLLNGGERLELRIGDVSGHGVPAALYMVLTETLFGDARISDLALPEALRRVNASLLSYFEDGAENFVTVFSGVLDLSSGRFRFAKAGHNPPVLFRRRTGEAILLDADGVFLGAFAYDDFEEKEIELEPGDLLVLYTDGVTEAANAAGVQFGLDRLVEGTRERLHLTARGHLHRILDEVREHTGSRRTEDDRTLLVVRREEEGWEAAEIGGSEEERDRWIAGALEEAARLGRSDAWRAALRLALVEALANAVEHGHRGDEARPVGIRWRIAPDKTVVRIADGGPGFQPRLDPHDLEIRPAFSDRGRGLEMILGSVDEVSFNREGNRITLVKYGEGEGAR